MEHLIKNNKEIDVKNIQTALSAGFNIYADGMGGQDHIKKLKIDKYKINRMWEDYVLYIENEKGDKYYLAKNLWDNSEVDSELKEALNDYIDSCHRQGRNFDINEIERFIKENEHMNLSDEDIYYIYAEEE